MKSREAVLAFLRQVLKPAELPDQRPRTINYAAPPAAFRAIVLFGEVFGAGTAVARSLGRKFGPPDHWILSIVKILRVHGIVLPICRVNGWALSGFMSGNLGHPTISVLLKSSP